MSQRPERAKRGQGPVVKKLIALLEAQGFADVAVIVTRGIYLQATHDCVRWSASARRGDDTVRLSSWDTATECARGLFFEAGKLVHEYVVWSKGRSPKSAALVP